MGFTIEKRGDSNGDHVELWGTSAQMTALQSYTGTYPNAKFNDERMDEYVNSSHAILYVCSDSGEVYILNKDVVGGMPQFTEFGGQ